ncbi:MAG: N-(5'-phosphoribosyl)anthranilate isomerase [Pseudarcicella sp.]|nr:N-(5'-phosphoribosyl)anthranilate isomerase [Pseudarcicella sp.]MBP6411777.1 N-(5'-phosphoribosyl)anthranilate isomerase [Pseudarcicella sp.]
MLKTTVKVSNITNLSDARYCAGMGVEMLGFDIDKLSLDKFNEMKTWLAGVQIVGETLSADWGVVEKLLLDYQPDMVQVSSVTNLSQLKEIGIPILYKVDFAKDNLPALFQSIHSDITYFVLENSEATAVLDDATLAMIDAWSFKYPILLGFGLKKTNLDDCLENTTINGFVFEGSEEIKPGVANSEALMDALETLESEDF